MSQSIRTKIQALVSDFVSKSIEVFEYTTSSIFTVAQENITITAVLVNGTAISESDYSFDEVTNKITITSSLVDGDVIEVDYTYYKYSDSELNEYIRASLVWLSIFNACDGDYEVDDLSGDEIEINPTPNSRTTDLIAIVASILIKPDYSSYKLPNVTVNYPRKFTKEEKIEKLISKFNISIGVSDTLEWNNAVYWNIY